MPKPSSRHFSAAGPQSMFEVCTSSGTSSRLRAFIVSSLARTRKLRPTLSRRRPVARQSPTPAWRPNPNPLAVRAWCVKKALPYLLRFHSVSHIEITHQAVQIVGMQTQPAGCLGDIAIRLIERGLDEKLFGFSNAIVKSG